jgi:hypothetical protein
LTRFFTQISGEGRGEREEGEIIKTASPVGDWQFF